MLDILLPLLRNIHAGPKTTILGIVLIGFSLFLFYVTQGAVLDTVMNSGLFTLGVIFLFLKDWQGSKLNTVK